ncbi:MAG: DNA-binding response regulator [Acaryochloridaceae cyanobacterium RL_2_7]|nr:DNA-binding response regulator [Acaryochloridaceae cyanobacterium RL_2_7]
MHPYSAPRNYTPPMMTPEQIQEIAKLRAHNVSPKLIARKLGLRPSEVSAQIRILAEQKTAERRGDSALDPLEACWINSNVYNFLLNPAETRSKEAPETLDGGLAIVTVVRQPKYNQYLLSTYLVDYWCLGVKDAMGPRTLKSLGLSRFLDKIYEGFDSEFTEISLNQAQSVVFSALDYATELGFSPHKDFETTREFLGEREDFAPITCGRNGKPCYVSGPYDNPQDIMNTLRAVWEKEILTMFLRSNFYLAK